MAFFDEISKKINGVTSTAAQKTKEMSEVSKLNSAMNEEETKINNAYYQIGRLYCANHSEDYEEGFGIFIDVVKDSEKKINAIKAQIREIKGIATCTNCGQDIPANVAFCSNCGAPAPAPKVEVDPNSVICPNCRTAVAKGMRFCTSCGYKFPEIQPQPVADPEPAPAPVEPVPVEEPQAEPVSMDIDVADATKFVMEQEKIVIPDNIEDTYRPEIAEAQQSTERYCTNCGKVLLEGMIFCTECGTKV